LQRSAPCCLRYLGLAAQAIFSGAYSAWLVLKGAQFVMELDDEYEG
jgi:hypothetical protein